MCLVKIPRSASMDVSIYHEKYKASFKNINITNSLRCKLKVAGVYCLFPNGISAICRAYVFLTSFNNL